MAQYAFDPGYGRHLASFVFSIEDIYKDINKYKNLKQKQFCFKQYYSGIIKLLNQNIEFYLGCLLWAVYLKSLDEGEIVGNHCLDKVYDEETSLVELVFLIKFILTFNKDTKYYMNQEFKYSQDDLEMLYIYKEFAQLNEGFVNTRKNTDLKLPSSLKTPTESELKKIKETIDIVVQTGEFNKLTELRKYII